MNEEAKADHVLECLAHIRQERKWTPSILGVTFLENCINTEFFEIQYVLTKDGRKGVSTKEIEYIPFEDPKNLWARIVNLVIDEQKNNTPSVSGIIETDRGPKEFKIEIPSSPLAEKVAGAKTRLEWDEEGTKFDDSKPRLGEMIMDFKKPLLEVCKVWEFGAKKYSKSNWKKVKNGSDRYTNALARHFAAEMDEGVDAETKLHHAIHVAWNALARLYFIIKEGNLGD